MTILDFTAAKPVSFARADVVDDRYRLVESLTDDDSGNVTVWRAYDAVLARHVLFDMVAIDGGEVCLDALLPKLGLELSEVLDVGDAQLEHKTFLYIASELPNITADVA